jgi:hypothetical protein
MLKIDASGGWLARLLGEKWAFWGFWGPKTGHYGSLLICAYKKQGYNRWYL